MKNNSIVLLDLFSGIGGFSLGISQAGFNIKTHYYSEIDKHAIAIYKYQFKDSEYVGSVTTLDGRTLERPNIITFGSPCQDFSVAGKRAGMAGQRSSLIGEAIRLIAECKPDIFVWENVKGVFSSNNGEDFWAVIQAFTNIGGYRLEWQLLNTAWFLPQNRERIYLVGHLTESPRGFKQVFPIGRSSGENDGNQKSNETTSVRTLSGGGHSGGNHSSMTLLKMNLKDGFRENDCNVSSTLQSRDYKGYGNQDMDFVVVAQRGRENGQELEIQKEDKTNSLTGVQKDNLLIVGNVGNGHETQNVYDPEGLAPTVRENHGKTTKVLVTEHEDNFVIIDENYASRTREYVDGRTTIHGNCGRFKVSNTVTPDAYLADGKRKRDKNGKAVLTSMHERRIRRLTPIECERLQGFPDDWTKYGDYDGVIKTVADTQRYKTLGNAVTVGVVKEVFKRML